MLDPFYNEPADRRPIIAAILIVVLGLGGIGLAGKYITGRSQRAKQQALEKQASALYEKAETLVGTGEYDNAAEILDVIVSRFATTPSANEAVLLRSQIRDYVSQPDDSLDSPCQSG